MDFDFILNGQAHGGTAMALLQNNMDPASMRPWLEPTNNGQLRSYVSVKNAQGVYEARPTFNAAATLRKEDWKALDDAIVKAAKPRLRFVGDLRAAGLTYSIPNGMGKTALETERQSDMNEAVISMDGMRESGADRPHFDLTLLPLPIVHKDFFFSARQLAASRNGGSPLDMTGAELAARRVAEAVEALALGVSPFSSYAHGGGTVYGLTNHPNANTKSMTLPTASSWTPAVTVNEVLEMRLQAQQDHHYGPYMLYCSLDWDVYLDDDYSSAKGDLTLRQRLGMIEGIQGVKTLDYLAASGTFKMVLVQMTSDVVRMVEGMPITTLQWESKGGMQINFKVMTIATPQIRADFNNNCGIVVGTAA
jgi:uncharacterized linocin/CFP29 family protein